jgi:hypothetical protein
MMYLKIAPKMLVWQATVRISYDAVSAFALISFYVDYEKDKSTLSEHTLHVLRSTVAKLDQGFA